MSRGGEKTIALGWLMDKAREKPGNRVLFLEPDGEFHIFYVKREPLKIIAIDEAGDFKGWGHDQEPPPP